MIALVKMKAIHVALLIGLLTFGSLSRGDDFVVDLPETVKRVWLLSEANCEVTPTRERVCINGLWRWQPAGTNAEKVPSGNWGYFKVPGPWPGITDYLQKDSQTVFRYPSWKNAALGSIRAAWYEREITVPNDWGGQRISLTAEYLNSYAVVFIDGKKVGELRFPGGELDLTKACKAGDKYYLSIYAVAMPLKEVMVSYIDTANAHQVKGHVPRRGLCGDVYLNVGPLGARLEDLKVETSVRQGQISISSVLKDLTGDRPYSLRARVLQDGRVVKEFTSAETRQNGRFTFKTNWKPDKLWDIHTPKNQHTLSLSLLDDKGEAVDVAHDVKFGFREFWIDGRDFYLNGSRIFLSAVPFDNAQIDADHASYASAKESMERLKSFGINFVYTHNYDCEPGSHLSFTEILRAADDVGMLVALTQPHFSHYDWKAKDADIKNAYVQHAAFYVQVAQNHPSVVFYTMSHNATGYSEDMNPDMTDGLEDPRDTWSRNNSKLALRAEAIVNSLDASRVVYHHAGGNIGAMHTSNFYPNFAPIQELSDWYEHWATKGVKPVFMCEYGAPFTWDWAMYRGWYKGERSFGSARVPWEFCFAEWNAQFLGDRAFKISEMEKANLRWEARQFRAGKLWHRWDYPFEIGSIRFDDRHTVMAQYIADNFRAYRTWGVSGTSPWEFGHYWRLRDGVNSRRKELPVDWNSLQKPGFSADYTDQQSLRMDTSFERFDWIPTADGEALIRNNRPLLAYIAGDAKHFTEKSHSFTPGQMVSKQAVVINNSREPVIAECETTFGPFQSRKKITVETGQQERVPLQIALPKNFTPGRYDLNMTVSFSNGEVQRDSLTIDVIAPLKKSPKLKSRIAVFDPALQTTRELASLGLELTSLGGEYRLVEATDRLADIDVLIIGKNALTYSGSLPSLSRVRDGLKVIVFEQKSDVLEKRLGFRVQEYGLRQVFPRVANHAILSGLSTEYLHDWRGDATLLPPRLDYKMRPMYGPTINWCDIPVTRVWRCGTRGNVASVLIEKPARGDFQPIIDGGFSLQYSPLMEYREGKGMIIFCQLDVSGRSETDPAGHLLADNLIKYVDAWKPVNRPSAVYAGEAAGKKHLEAAGFAVNDYASGSLNADRVLVVGPGGGKVLAPDAPAIAAWLKAGGKLLAIGLAQDEANAFLPFAIETRKREHIASHFDAFDASSSLAGIGPADVHNRDPRDFPLITAGATVIGDGALAQAEGSNVVFCQLVPWQFDYGDKPNIKRTYRRTSFLVTRLLSNMGVESSTPILERIEKPVAPGEKRWSDGLYLDQPEEMDDPYRFFRW